MADFFLIIIIFTINVDDKHIAFDHQHRAITIAIADKHVERGWCGGDLQEVQSALVRSPPTTGWTLATSYTDD